MKVSGFTFIRNAIKYDYPVAEAIKSILPICDEVVVAVGKSEDETLLLIKNIDPKVRILETVWDETLKEGGEVLASETNKAFHGVDNNSDWCFYIQGDEAIHEKYHHSRVLDSLMHSASTKRHEPISRVQHRQKHHRHVSRFRCGTHSRPHRRDGTCLRYGHGLEAAHCQR